MAFLLYLCAGFLSGLIGGMGMGGGTVMIPALTFFCGVGQHAAQVTNLISFLPMAGVSLAVHKKQGLVCTRGLAAIIIPAVITSLLGALVALILPAVLLRRLFGAFLIVLAVRGAFSLFAPAVRRGGASGRGAN